MKKIRGATKEEMIEIYKMGYDVWGDNLPYEADRAALGSLCLTNG